MYSFLLATPESVCKKVNFSVPILTQSGGAPLFPDIQQGHPHSAWFYSSPKQLGHNLIKRFQIEKKTLKSYYELLWQFLQYS